MKFYKDKSGVIFGIEDDEKIPKGCKEVSQKEVDANNDRIAKEEFNSLSLDEKRFMKYPNTYEFIDAYVKIHSNIPELVVEGEKQMDNYIKDCLKVKKAYPKK